MLFSELVILKLDEVVTKMRFLDPSLFDQIIQMYSPSQVSKEFHKCFQRFEDLENIEIFEAMKKLQAKRVYKEL